MKSILLLFSFVSFVVMAAEFSELQPASGSQVELLKGKHIAFLDGRAERQAKNFTEWVEMKELVSNPHDDCQPQPVVFRWQVSEGVVPLRLVLTGDTFVRRVDIQGKNSVEVYNLMAGVDYRWYLEGVDAAGTPVRSAINSFRTSPRPPRLIRLPGISNVRDFGGWKTADGKYVIRQGLLYRGGEFDGHQHITPEGLEVLKNDLRLKTDLDLRGMAEIEKGMPEYPLASIGVQLIHKPMPGSEYATLRHKKAVAELMHILANPAVYPLYTHCWGGADRTGELIMLLQAILGVGDEELFDDYEMTSFGRWGERSRHSEVYTKVLAALAEYGDDNTPISIKAEAFLKDGGLSQQDIDTLRAIFLKKL